MLGNHTVLPGSLSASLKKVECTRCKQEKTPSDGIYMGHKFVCGVCWRRQATVIGRQKGSK